MSSTSCADMPSLVEAAFCRDERLYGRGAALVLFSRKDSVTTPSTPLTRSRTAATWVKSTSRPEASRPACISEGTKFAVNSPAV